MGGMRGSSGRAVRSVNWEPPRGAPAVLTTFQNILTSTRTARALEAPARTWANGWAAGPGEVCRKCGRRAGKCGWRVCSQKLLA